MQTTSQAVQMILTDSFSWICAWRGRAWDVVEATATGQSAACLLMPSQYWQAPKEVVSVTIAGSAFVPGPACVSSLPIRAETPHTPPTPPGVLGTIC